jgi:hypothetical protein
MSLDAKDYLHRNEVEIAVLTGDVDLLRAEVARQRQRDMNKAQRMARTYSHCMVIGATGFLAQVVCLGSSYWPIHLATAVVMAASTYRMNVRRKVWHARLLRLLHHELPMATLLPKET